MKTDFMYNISFPSQMVAGKKYPVIYAMHGMGSNDKDIVNLIKNLKEDFIIIGLRGNINMNYGYAYFTIKRYGTPNEELFIRAIERLENFIENAPKEFPIDESNQFLFGFSQGAILSMSLALKLGDVIKGFVALSGYIPTYAKENFKNDTFKNVEMLVIHGKFDSIFSIEVGDETYNYLKERSDNVTYKVYSIGHEVSMEEKIEFHKWFKLRK